jgi:integrase
VTTVGEYLREWLQLQRSQLQPSTLESYRSNVERYLVPALGDVPLDQLTAAQLSAFYSRLQHSGRHRSGQPLSLRTVQYCHGVIHKALGDAVRHELLARNVAMNATLPKVDLRGDRVAEIHAWTAEELRRFLDHTRATPRQSLWHLAAATGMRRGELLGLRWDDVDLAGRTLSVRRSLSVIKHDARLKQPKTSRCRTLRVDAATTAVIEARRREQDEHRTNAAAWRNEWNLVFTETDGRHLDPMRITHEFRLAARDAPVPRIRLHDLRHTHATLLLQAGVPVKVVSERLGHATISLTLDIYAHVLPAMDADAADRFAATVFGDR